ncbi:unnamed protein product, partial [Iphiclides podalirius]
MEDVARLAVIEQTLCDFDKFNKVLHDLLDQIEQILKNPHDFEARSLKGKDLKSAMEHEAFCDYLQYIGFQAVQDKYIYPKEQTLDKLRLAKAAIERKISICYGSKPTFMSKPLSNLVQAHKPKLKPVNIVTTNDLYEKFKHFSMKVRQHQAKLKFGELTGNDLSYEIAFLMELMAWFKYDFFSWVDKPNCERCRAPTIHFKNDVMNTETETCRVEIYKCADEQCTGENSGARFPRYNDLATLLRTRRGRCGEWANCFALFCRAYGYDTRYVYDTTDHVWCEVYDHGTDRWLHVDPCECLLDAPLTYCCGWRKIISYVIAVSRDDVQDVTWRYVTHHKQAVMRRDKCGELELISSLMSLRAARQAMVSEARKSYLIKRCVKELVQLMVEREADESEFGGRVSGSAQWRKNRREQGASGGHTFEYSRPGSYAVEYCAAEDRYEFLYEGRIERRLGGHSSGAYACESLFRKVETDWRQVYLAREEGADAGSISWRLAVTGDCLNFEYLSVELGWAQFYGGRLTFTVQFNAEPPLPLDFEEGETSRIWTFHRRFKEAVLRCQLSGGSGDVAWQHAQLFRQELGSKDAKMLLETNVVKTPPPE